MHRIFIIIGIGLLILNSCKDLEKVDFLEIETLEATNTTLTSAQLNGSINGLNKREVQSYGFVWSTTASMPTESNNDGLFEQIEKKQSGDFSWKLENLSPNQTYYVRAFAKLEGRATLTLGTVKSFLTNTITLSTETELYEGGRVVTIKGSVMGLDAGFPISQHGHVWSSSNPIPTIEQDSFTNLGKLLANGDFSSSLPNLKQHTNYFIRAYFITNNGQNVVYEPEVFMYQTELYDFWENKSPPPNTIGSGGILDGLAFTIGEKAYIGLEDKKLWEFTPSTNTWKKIDNHYPGSSNNPTVYFSVGNKGYAGLGYGLHRDIYEFDGETWNSTPVIQLPEAIDSKGFKLPVFVFGQQVYIVTTTDRQIFQVHHFDFENNKQRKELDSIESTSLSGRSYFDLNNKGYIIGTGRNGEEVSVFDPAAAAGNQWSVEDKLFIKGGTFLGIGFSIENEDIGKGYYMGASNGLEHTNKLFEYDNNPTKETEWIRKRSLPASPRIRNIGFSINGKGYAGFGENSIGTRFMDLWEYTPKK